MLFFCCIYELIICTNKLCPGLVLTRKLDLRCATNRTCTVSTRIYCAAGSAVSSKLHHSNDKKQASQQSLSGKNFTRLEAEVMSKNHLIQTHNPFTLYSIIMALVEIKKPTFID